MTEDYYGTDFGFRFAQGTLAGYLYTLDLLLERARSSHPHREIQLHNNCHNAEPGPDIIRPN
jgi:hypothetical protein